MADYPPPPPAGGFVPPPATGLADPSAAAHALEQWAHARGFALNPHPDVRWYQAWFPFVYLPKIARVGREVRAVAGEASCWIVETFEGDPLKQATWEDRHVVAFLTSPRLVYRGAVRSRLGGGIIDDVGKGLGELFGSGGGAGNRPAGSVLGDPTFEGRYEVAVPTAEEGAVALPVPLRHLLLQTQWRGVLEIRTGGLACVFFDRAGFDPLALDGTFALLGEIYRLATAYPHPVTPPPTPA